MTIIESSVQIGDHQLHRLELKPSIPERGGFLFFHGQGDYIDRYPPILEDFVKAGFRGILTDLPGHGRSGGRRGHVPAMSLVDALLEDSLRSFEHPVVLIGHSMGGLLALHFLLKHPEKFSAAWLSSPLLDPTRRAAPWMRAVLPTFSRFFPRVTVSTGVRSEDCRDDAREEPAEPTSESLYHSRVSISWGRELRDAAAEIEANFQDLNTDRPILFTQGTDDQICPPEILQERLTKRSHSQTKLHLIEGAKHEPFVGSTEAKFRAILQAWIVQNLVEA